MVYGEIVQVSEGKGMRQLEALAWQELVSLVAWRRKGKNSVSADWSCSMGVVSIEVPLKVIESPRMKWRWTNIFDWLFSCPLPMFSIGQTHQKSKGNSVIVIHVGQLSRASNSAWMGKERIWETQPNMHILVTWPGSQSCEYGCWA